MVEPSRWPERDDFAHHERRAVEQEQAYGHGPQQAQILEKPIGRGPVGADGEVEQADPEKPQRHEAAQHHPRKDERAPQDEELKRVDAGLVHLAEDGQKNTNQRRGRQEQNLTHQPVEPEPRSTGERDEDRSPSQPEFVRIRQPAPIVSKETHHAGDDQNDAKAQQHPIEPCAPRQVAAKARLQLRRLHRRKGASGQQLAQERDGSGTVEEWCLHEG
jgi:hypothetical protein